MDVELLIADLKAGQLPAAARRWLIAGFERWQQGAELAAALGLDSAPLDRRDDLLRVVLRLSPGDSIAAKCAYASECLNGGRDHASTMAAELVCKLLANGEPVPRSIKHLRRILLGSRQEAETENSVLCPSWPAPDNAENTEEEQSNATPESTRRAKGRRN